jgi:8-oxo-dGTP pyrophosphatase MutT (NUDIX family)
MKRASVTIIQSRATKRIAIVKTRKKGYGLPGGSVEEADYFKEDDHDLAHYMAAIRELKEETGIDCKNISKLETTIFVNKNDHSEHEVVFFVGHVGKEFRLSYNTTENKAYWMSIANFREEMSRSSYNSVNTSMIDIAISRGLIIE